ncbi:glycosyltransferase [Acetobacter musti]|uniref:Glycosyltransferase n=1 Tax=Acetobacter musti TaxID=864732 RepID=A0ABX0JXS2_9PROT|nr:glycosyltransferase family 2 protein [Acetobacter musti]NHN86602.1 glycosyltransferase [Acetobacter musti]
MSKFENHVSDIVRLFRAGLGRNPEVTAVDHFLELIAGGATFHDLAHAIAGSQEFRNLHGSSDICNPAYAAFLYRHCLNREPDPLGEANILRAPNRGAALEIVAGSEEAKKVTDLLEVLYPDGASPSDNLAYRLWLRRYGILTHRKRLAISLWIDREMAVRPTISLFMLAPENRVDLLLETVASLEQQIYPEWTLQIACTDDIPAGVIDSIVQVTRRVAGISIVMMSGALSYGERWQRLLEVSDGDFCAFLYPGDRLSLEAFYSFAAEIVANPDCDLIYCDEDKLDARGERSSPRFKSAWSRELCYAGDFIGQLAVFRRERALLVGGIRHDSGDLARYDLMLRLCENLEAVRIRHISKVLYHRSRRPGREEGFPKTRATLQHPSVLGTVRRHLAETHPEIKLESAYLGGAVWPHIVYPLPENPPCVSIVIPTKDNADMLERCVSGLLTETSYVSIEILIADNGSCKVETLDTLRRLSRDTRVTVFRMPGPFNWSAINNDLATRTRSKLLLFLNDDVEIMESGWLDEMVRQVLQPGVGVVGARLFYRDGSIQHAGIALTPQGARHILRSARAEDSGYMGVIALARDLLAVTGACMMVRREAFDQVEGFDETFPLTCNDVDFCLRARQAGWRVVWTPHAFLMHVDGATRGPDHSASQILQSCVDDGRLLDRWARFNKTDPYINANLMVTDHHLLLRTPDDTLKS